MDKFINQIIEGDCLEVMKDIHDKSVDLVITSPPYNLGNNHHTGNIKHKAYNDNFPEKKYQQWQIEVLSEIFRILKNDGSVIYNHKNRIKNGEQITPYEWLLKTSFIIKQEIIWFNGSQNFDKIRFYPMTERIYWLAKDRKTVLYNAINHHDLFSKNEWKPEGINKEHTRAFPLKFAEDIITCFPQSKIVLDPFLGSGTTAVAALNTGRFFIGIEKEPQYVEIARKRVEQAQMQQSLFNKGGDL